MAHVRKLSSGRWQCQIRLQRLRPITRSFDTKAKANRFARQIESETELAHQHHCRVGRCGLGGSRQTARAGWSPAVGTQLRYESTLSAMLGLFIRANKITNWPNPIRAEMVARFAENPGKDRFPNQVEQRALLDACRRSTWNRMYPLIFLVLTTGARKGELPGLSWGDIDLQAGQPRWRLQRTASRACCQINPWSRS